jgi:hypothetical protein
MSSRFLDLREYYDLTSIPCVFCLSCSPLTPFVHGRNVKRTLENLSAGEVELSTEDLAEIGKLLEKYPVKGSRFVDGVDQSKSLFWN